MSIAKTLRSNIFVRFENFMRSVNTLCTNTNIINKEVDDNVLMCEIVSVYKE